MRYAHLLIAALILPTSNGCALFWPKVEKCSDGNPVTIYEDPYIAYASVAESYEAEITGITGGLAKIATTFGVNSVSLAKKITVLQEQLNQENIMHQNNLKTLVIVHNTRPCDSTITTALFNFLEGSKARQQTLAKFQWRLATVSDESEAEKVISEIPLPEEEFDAVKKK